MTVLSICIPTRNGQDRAIDAVRNLLRSERRDFEVLLADNSDDPGPLAEFAHQTGDARLRLLASAGQKLSTAENWNRLLNDARGEWVTIIDDCDYADPELCEVIGAIVKRVPQTDAIAWGRASYVWPEARNGQEITHIGTGSDLNPVDQKEMMRKLFFWDGASNLPDCGFGAYHGAVRRTLLARIKEGFSGICFEQDNPRWDNACKTVLLAESLVFWERPMSVLGACERPAAPEVGNPASLPAVDFPFPAHLGATAATAQTIEAFKQRYGIDLDGWEANFIKACARDCETRRTPREFKACKDGYISAIKAWRGKTARAGFQPEFKWRPDMPRFQGHIDNTLYFDMDMGEPKTAAEFYDVIDTMLFPVSLLDSKLA